MWPHAGLPQRGVSGPSKKSVRAPLPLLPVGREEADQSPHTLPSSDGERLSGVTDGRGAQVGLSTQRTEDSSESHEEEQVGTSADVGEA